MNAFQQINTSLPSHLSRVIRTLLFLFLFLAGPASGVMLVEFCPDPYLPHDRDEYLCLEGWGPAEGIMVTDGEGGFRFPPGTVLSGRTVVAMDAEAYRSSHGHAPDFEWDGHSPEVPDAIRTGRFQLSNAGDEILVYSGGVCIQKVEWPGTVSARQGQVHFFSDGRWDGRVLMLGQSQFAPATFHDAGGIAFVSPDCSREVFSALVMGAEEEILVSIYEFTSPVLSGFLEEAAARGVAVEVLLEGGPVGGIPGEEHDVVARLLRSGITVRTMQGTDLVHSPYRFLHSKYMVIDRSRVLVTSENFKENGFPERGVRGNRGWGVALTHPGLAEYLRSVYLHDAGGEWTVGAVPKAGDPEIPTFGKYPAVFSPYVFEGATVTPVISPDTSSLLHPLILNAKRSVDIEMAYITNETAQSLNPFLADAVNVSRRGIPVRVILDSYYYNTDKEADNDELVDLINGMAAAEGLPLEARCAYLGPEGVEKIHNKGVIVDREQVLVSSINWNMNSPTFNREVGVIIHHPGVGEYYSLAFESDWEKAGQKEVGRGPDRMKIAAACVVIAALLLLFWYRRRGGRLRATPRNRG